MIRKEKGKKEGKQNRRTREEGKAFLFLWRKIGAASRLKNEAAEDERKRCFMFLDQKSFDIYIIGTTSKTLAFIRIWLLKLIFF